MNAIYQINKCKTILFVLAFIGMAGCKKLVDVQPPITSTTSASVYNADATAIAVLTGFYSTMSASQLAGPTTINTLASLYPGLSADEFTVYNYPGISQSLVAYYENNLNAAMNPNIWAYVYPLIFNINQAIVGLSASNGLTPVIKQQLLGEAEFLRALHYFYLTNLYGDLPLVTDANYKTASLLAKTAQSVVYRQIISDLLDAQTKLSSNYLDATLLNTTAERVRPTYWAATALLARVYLYTNNWDSAAIESGLVIGNAMYSLDTLNGVFLANSTEAIWQLQPVNAGINTTEAQFFIIPSTGLSTTNPVYLNTALVNSFETGDQRRADWMDSVTVSAVTYYYPFKYKVSVYGAPVTEYEMMLRLGEQYLIRAEAEAESGSPDAVSDLNVIRNRAGLANYAGPTDKASLLTAIMRERRVELFTEWGHRWLDLKRTSTVDSVMGPGGTCAAKNGVWKSTAQWYPVPIADLSTDPNLVQNSGY